MSDYVEIKAKTVDEAITKAMLQLETTSDHLDYTVIEKGNSGFLGIGAKSAVIKVRKKDDAEMEAMETSVPAPAKKPVKEEQPIQNKTEVKPEIRRENKPENKHESKPENKPVSKPENKEPKKQEFKESKKPAPESKPAAPEKVVVPIDVTPLLGKADAFLNDVFKAMKMDVAVEVKASEEVNTIDIELRGQDMGVLIGKRGQTLDSLQYLTSIIVNAEQEEYVRVKVDTENYRERRKETLENLAKNIASKVKRTRKASALEPMNPYERRIIHSALQKDKYVETHSEGEEPYRKVIITPNKNIKPPYNGGGNRGHYGNKPYRGGNNNRPLRRERPDKER